MPEKSISECVMEDIARRVANPFEYVMVLQGIGFGRVFSEKKAAVRIWNKVHPDRRLPLPRRGAQ